jgi:hypothetical protein
VARAAVAATNKPATTLTIADIGRPAAAAGAAAARASAKAAEAGADAGEMVRAPLTEAAKTVVSIAPAAKLPKPPELATLTAATWATHALALSRAAGALQVKMLDHACAELKATLGEAETLAKTDSAADAIAFQAKAWRRAFESYSAHLTDLARTAQTVLKQG